MNKVFMAAAVAAVFGFSAMAHAQYNDTLGDVTPTNLSVRVGGQFGLDTTMRNISNFWFGAGADINLPNYIPGTKMYVSLDWLTHTTNGGHGNVFPVCLDFRVPLDKQVKGYHTYAFAGVGAFFDDIYSSETVLGVRGGIGADLGPNIFAEATLYLSAGDHSYHTNAVGVYLGYRF